MASNRLKRTMRGALAATAVVAVIGATPSLADPAPSNNPAPPTMPTGTPLQQYQQLATQASDLQEQLLTAQDQQKKAQTTLDQANADLGKAQQALQAAENQEAGLRGQVDQLTEAQYEGARFGQLSALLTGSSAKDYLDKATMLQDLAVDSSKTLGSMQAATDAATAAQQRASKDQKTALDATNAANALVAQIHQEQNQLAPLIQQAQNAEKKVAPSALKQSLNPNDFIAPPGAAGTAIRTAEAQIGKPYVWAAAGPGSFDCSGLMLYSWAAAGISLPHSSQEQSTMGAYVPLSQLQPGDLIFFGSSSSTIHHVGMYVGNGDMVDAPNSGEDVKIQPIFSGALFGRRLAG
ncbi:MAG TPA: NlpC/P60 family protein [Pseudonocardiaceae bacterium]|nr:NlpC/P60 family protein [Pseudonocardiaceae bacterium]